MSKVRNEKKEPSGGFARGVVIVLIVVLLILLGVLVVVEQGWIAE